MNNGLYKPTGWLSRLVGRCFNLGPPSGGQATELLRQTDPGDTLLGQCDGASLPHDTLCIQDVSGSMGWTDGGLASRLDASKKAAEAFIRGRAARSPGDRIAIITFNNHAHVALPLTEISRLDTILLCLSSLRVAGGTDIAAGLEAAYGVFAQDAVVSPPVARYRRILLLTDGQGGRPLPWATRLKNAGVLLEIIGVGGDPAQVNAPLLRKVATTDNAKFTHYWFFRDTDSLVAHYEDLASGIVYRGHGE